MFYEGLGVLVIASYSLCLLSYSFHVFLATCVPFIIFVDCGTCSLIVRSVCVITLDWGKVALCLSDELSLPYVADLWALSPSCPHPVGYGHVLWEPLQMPMRDPPLHYALDMMFFCSSCRAFLVPHCVLS